jgi:hypothetical protein
MLIIIAFPRQQLSHEHTHIHCAYTIQGDHECEIVAEFELRRLYVFHKGFSTDVSRSLYLKWNTAICSRSWTAADMPCRTQAHYYQLTSWLKLTVPQIVKKLLNSYTNLNLIIKLTRTQWCTRCCATVTLATPVQLVSSTTLFLLLTKGQ